MPSYFIVKIRIMSLLIRLFAFKGQISISLQITSLTTERGFVRPVKFAKWARRSLNTHHIKFMVLSTLSQRITDFKTLEVHL